MKTPFLVALGGLLFLLVLGAVSASACGTHYPIPETTLADRVINSDVLIAVREKPEKAYTFEVVRSIKGEGAPEEVHVFIDAASRRRLADNPRDVVLLSRNGSAEYRFFAYATPQVQKLVETSITNAPLWQTESGREDRCRYFLRFFNDHDPAIRDMAYLEVSRAPYRLLKDFAAEVDRKTLYAFLGNGRYLEWHPLAILLLGQSPHPDDRDYIAKEFHSLAKHGLATNLAAWTTAFVESQSLDPEHTTRAIARVSELYFARSDRSAQEIEEVLKGLSVLGITDKTILIDRETREKTAMLRRNLVAGYQLLLETHPASAGAVARHLASWRVNALTAQLRAINEQGAGISEDSKLALKSYLSMFSGFAPLAL